MSSLTDRAVFVTGASSGIGRATALAFAREGCRLAVAARRLERLQELEPELKNAGAAEVLLHQLDVREQDEAESAVAAVHRTFGAVDILVNNAGLARGYRTVEDGDDAEWREMIETNVMGLLWITRSTIPIMKSQGRGHIIMLGSIAGHEPYAFGNVYSGTKHAVRAIAKSLRLELVGDNIRVSSVDPGMVETEFSLVRFSGDEQRAQSVYKGMQPLKAEDIADCILFAASRPDHVNIDEILVMPTAQASATTVHRTE